MKKRGGEMSVTRFIAVSVLLAVLALTGISCEGSPAGDREASRQKAEEFVRMEATFRFDGITETLKTTGTTSIAGGWRYTIEFDSRHAGYGNRSGQVLAQVITHHVAEVTVQAGLVTEAIMDEAWDMMEQRMINGTEPSPTPTPDGDMEISLAPIHEVDVLFMESFPVQVGVYIKGGLRDGCTTFNDAIVSREGNTINIVVTTQHPRDAACPAVYGYFERNLNLGSDFTAGVTYTLKVNDFTTAFEMP